MVRITANTKISELIKHNPESINAIASIAKPLEKLKNPILRKIMASRVTIAEAAKMSGVALEDFERVLAPIGFVFEGGNFFKEETQNAPKPDWLLNAPTGDLHLYDVRPIIDSGADPLKEILHRFKEVPAGKILCIINNFVPTPLIHLLKQEKAEDSFVETVSNQEFHTYFLKKAKEPIPSEKAEEKQVIMDDEASFNAVCSEFSNEKMRKIDVRGLEMPGPMQMILGELETLGAGAALFVDHKRIPVHLLEELADKNYEIHIYSVSENDVKILIFKKQ